MRGKPGNKCTAGEWAQIGRRLAAEQPEAFAREMDVLRALTQEKRKLRKSG